MVEEAEVAQFDTMISLVAEVQHVIGLRESLKAELVFHGYSDVAGRMGDLGVDIRNVTHSPLQIHDMQRPVSRSASKIHDTWLCRKTGRSTDSLLNPAVIPQGSRIPDRERTDVTDEAHKRTQDSRKAIRPKSSVRAAVHQDGSRIARFAETGFPSQESYMKAIRHCGGRDREPKSETVPLLRRWLPPGPSRIPKPPVSKDNTLICSAGRHRDTWPNHTESCIPRDSDLNHSNSFCIFTQQDSGSSQTPMACDRRAGKSASRV